MIAMFWWIQMIRLIFSFLDEDEIVPCHMNLEDFIVHEFNEAKEMIEQEKEEERRKGQAD